MSQRDAMKTTQSWHDKTCEQSLAELKTGTAGLDEIEAKQRLSNFGPNRLTEPARRHVLLRFLHHFHNILIYVLLIAAGITTLLDRLLNTFVIIAVVIINAIIGFLQEGKAETAMEAIRHMLALRAAVIRGGRRQTIVGEELVPGDIVLLEAGDKVPADLRLLTSHGLQIQESILTGESMAATKQTEPVAKGAPLGDRSSMAYSGTTVVSGQAMGVVVATGGETEIGRISVLLARVEMLTTPLVAKMEVFAKWLTLFILTLASLILLVGYFVLHQDFTDLFMAVVGLSVAAIPEGLPAVLTITLAMGVQIMARHNAIIRLLPAIETLGSISVICSDKTGTFTRNEMKVASVITSRNHFNVDGSGYEPAGDIRLEEQTVTIANHPALLDLGRTAALCNNAVLTRVAETWQVEGDPMEGALLAFAGKTGFDDHKAHIEWTCTDMIPFDAEHKFMATLNHDHKNKAAIFVKGAPEKVLTMCRKQGLSASETEPLDHDYWEEQAQFIASQGQRVLALAAKPMKPEHMVLAHADIEDSLIFLGLVGLMDPPRPEAIMAVAECHLASIEVKMITGDHAATAVAIGNQLGLRNTNRVLTGAELDTLDEATLAARVSKIGIFARTSPEHKLRLVMALQANGMTVAMTGDGVNDAPALKRADVGISMGKNGSEAAKEAAEIVLTDDNFASIVAAIREGRRVHDNIKKVINWTLPTNAAEALTIVLALMLGMTLPITPILILWVNTITAVTLGIALAFEPTEKKVMLRPPRPHGEPLLSGELLWHVALVASLFLIGVFGIFNYAIERGYSVNLARTIAMNTLVMLETFQLFFIRNMHVTSLSWKAVRGTKAVWIAVSTVILGQFAITYLPWLQMVFETEEIALLDLFLIIGIGALTFIAIEIEKQIRLRLYREFTLVGIFKKIYRKFSMM
ncbi:probable cation-transporting ATPase [Desulfotalea psychrophila LSv54]|uniref:Probable cation-transporting ATPase n=2 Tax=Desulfotalea psychrophila TaxID=84980 RepID=Q6ARI9_DESPS|nr:probable cation-transporting ATPase [Desulfotalea psychrophila LSv54]